MWMIQQNFEENKNLQQNERKNENADNSENNNLKHQIIESIASGGLVYTNDCDDNNNYDKKQKEIEKTLMIMLLLMRMVTIVTIRMLNMNMNLNTKCHRCKEMFGVRDSNAEETIDESSHNHLLNINLSDSQFEIKPNKSAKSIDKHVLENEVSKLRFKEVYVWILHKERNTPNVDRTIQIVNVVV